MPKVKVSQNTLDHVNDMILENRNKGVQKFCLFLDFDGVINVFLDPDDPATEDRLKKMATRFDFADRKCVARLNQLLHDYPIDAVISSSWRYEGLQPCIDYLKNAGLKETDKVVGVTEIDLNKTRQEVICDYLLKHPYYSGFLVFDDIPMPEFPNEWVETYPFQGYDSERDVYARNLLQKAMDKI